jgi:EC042_2821-lke REase
MADAAQLLKRAATAKRSSKRVALREDFDSGARGDWLELVRDVAAIANSGGGVVVVRSAIPLEEELLHDQLARYVEPDFEAFELHDVTRGGRTETAVLVDGVMGAPLVFSAQGRYRDPDGREHVVFAEGGLYFRRGARSEPPTGEDVRDFIRRQLDATRQQWLANIRQVMHAPDRAEVAIVETAERDEEGRPTLIRLTTDPHAPLYGQVDPDLSHPYRQKEVIAEVNKRLDRRSVNAFDILSVRRVYAISEQTRPEFVHVPKFGSPQYSDAFVDWLVDQDTRDPRFFENAKAGYLATRRRR